MLQSKWERFLTEEVSGDREVGQIVGKLQQAVSGDRTVQPRDASHTLLPIAPREKKEAEKLSAQNSLLLSWNISSLKTGQHVYHDDYRTSRATDAVPTTAGMSAHSLHVAAGVEAVSKPIDNLV